MIISVIFVAECGILRLEIRNLRFLKKAGYDPPKIENGSATSCLLV
jgi:hypothetical protein